LIDLAQRDDQRVVHPVDRLAGRHAGLIVLGLGETLKYAVRLPRHAGG
jgi:hypothetical protein